MNSITWIQPYYDLILNMIPLEANNILDVGAGYGVFGGIVKKARNVSLHAVEPFLNYDLNHYDYVSNITWGQFYKITDTKYDVLVSTEMIEHLPKPEAMEFLSESQKVANKVIIATPYHWEEQEAYDDNEYQVHQCIMTVKDFTNNGYKVSLLGTIAKKGLTGRILFHPKWLKVLKIIGVKPTNIIAEWTLKA